jgi:hypothetical protein
MRRGSILAALSGFVLAAIYYTLRDILRAPWERK